MGDLLNQQEATSFLTWLMAYSTYSLAGPFFPALLRSQVTPLAKVKFLLAKTVPFLQLGENSKNWEEGSCGGCYSHSIDGLLI